MAVTCPTCQRTIDPVRAPVVRVVNARVVGYCSMACADGAPVIAAPLRSAPTATASVPSRPATAPIPEAVAFAETSSSTSTRRRRRRQVVALCATTIAGGMAIAIVEAVSPATPTRVDAAIAPAPAPAPAREAPTAAVLHRRALAELQALLSSPSPRVQRIAAMALARTRDPAALAALADALAAEGSEIARLDIGYALGRGGDPRGVAALTKAVAASSRRDVKADAARLLLQLGDTSGVDELHDMVRGSANRLGAAEVLATAGDAKGIEALNAVRADSSATPDERLRAAVALGKGGQASPGLAEELRAALADGRYNVGAAAALARLGDPAAVPALESQLAVPSLRVGAAVSLRRLRPDLDPTPLLPALAAALGADRDVATVSAAEAILVLTGPADLAARD
jgi:hypothetical protein